MKDDLNQHAMHQRWIEGRARNAEPAGATPERLSELRILVNNIDGQEFKVRRMNAVLDAIEGRRAGRVQVSEC